MHNTKIEKSFIQPSSTNWFLGSSNKIDPWKIHSIQIRKKQQIAWEWANPLEEMQNYKMFFWEQLSWIQGSFEKTSEQRFWGTSTFVPSCSRISSTIKSSVVYLIECRLEIWLVILMLIEPKICKKLPEKKLICLYREYIIAWKIALICL